MLNLATIKHEIDFIKQQWQIFQREYAKTDSISCDPVLLLAYIDNLIVVADILVTEIEGKTL